MVQVILTLVRPNPACTKILTFRLESTAMAPSTKTLTNSRELSRVLALLVSQSVPATMPSGTTSQTQSSLAVDAQLFLIMLFSLSVGDLQAETTMLSLETLGVKTGATVVTDTFLLKQASVLYFTTSQSSLNSDLTQNLV